VPANVPSRFERKPAAVREAEQPVGEPEFVPLERADAEAGDEEGFVVVPEVEDDDVHEAVSDLDEIVSDDGDAEEEN
jgi:hypothetical protein